MKHLATSEPEKPLKWLSEFLAMKRDEARERSKGAERQRRVDA
jgi:hypothetical protein